MRPSGFLLFIVILLPPDARSGLLDGSGFFLSFLKGTCFLFGPPELAPSPLGLFLLVVKLGSSGVVMGLTIDLEEEEVAFGSLAEYATVMHEQEEGEEEILEGSNLDADSSGLEAVPRSFDSVSSLLPSPTGRLDLFLPPADGLQRQHARLSDLAVQLMMNSGSSNTSSTSRTSKDKEVRHSNFFF